MLLLKFLVFVLVQIVYGHPTDTTFKNVNFNGYRMFTPKFRPTILSGNSLKDYLPNKDFDTIEFIDQNIPVLYQDSIADITELSELIIESSNVREIRPGAFKNLPNLNRLSLKVNKIERIENEVFNNLTIHSLDLSYNRIEKIYDRSFDNLPYIFYINLAYNKISKWNPNWFRNTPELSSIFFKNNLIEELPDHSFANLKSDKNMVRNLNLVFSNNKISKIRPQAFTDLKKINQLALSNNSIEKFEKDLLQNTLVNDLRLNNNSIVCFDEGSFDTIFRGQSVYIEFNPFYCDCVKKMQKWAKKNNNKNLGINDIDCGEDDEDSGDADNGAPVLDIEEVLFNRNGKRFNTRITLVLPKN